MRLDKFLKVSRIIKRRTVANEVCDAGRVTVNGRDAKAAYQVKVGDELTITIGTKSIRAKVRSVEDSNNKDAARDMYEILEERL